MMIGCTTTPSSPIVTAVVVNDIHGKVVYRNECGKSDPYVADIIVTATNGSWTGSDTTSSDGVWSIPNPPAGVYTITAQRGTMTSNTITNVQYVGSGLYDPRMGLGLSAWLPESPFVSATVDSMYWTYDVVMYEGVPRYSDSVFHLKTSVVSVCADLSSFDYRIAETADATCDEALVSGYYGNSTGTLQKADLAQACEKLRQLYGTSLAGKHLYLQVRPGRGVINSEGNQGCSSFPKVVDLYF